MNVRMYIAALICACSYCSLLTFLWLLGEVLDGEAVSRGSRTLTQNNALEGCFQPWREATGLGDLLSARLMTLEPIVMAKE